jgi:hypothetical protein
MKLTFSVCYHYDAPTEGDSYISVIEEHTKKIKEHLEAGGMELMHFHPWDHRRMFSLESGLHNDSAEMPKGRPIAVARGEPFVSPTVEWHKLSEFAKSKSAKDLEPLKEAIDEFQQRFPTDE